MDLLETLRIWGVGLQEKSYQGEHCLALYTGSLRKCSLMEDEKRLYCWVLLRVKVKNGA